ncbi:hypothetical protein E2C01_038844 [Portunus trituberculatus]|uniref:Uncharacterized protein n=1 Tax=Portunus trituberculatus TaxID=210409 RepID=A0A5B7FI00_PORTR|nr:hypothetical protein [Portunus trituberculatus]
MGAEAGARKGEDDCRASTTCICFRSSCNPPTPPTPKVLHATVLAPPVCVTGPFPGGGEAKDTRFHSQNFMNGSS